jgi:hypothetical protein
VVAHSSQLGKPLHEVPAAFSVGGLVQALVAAPVGMPAEMYVGVPAAVLAAAAAANAGPGNAARPAHLAVLCGSAAGGDAANAAGAPGGGRVAQQIEQALAQAAAMDAAAASIASTGAAEDGGADVEAVGDAREHAMADARAAVALAGRMAERAYLMEPRLFNRAAFRAAEIPAANGHFTARALAAFYARLGGALMAGAASPPRAQALVPAPRLRQATRCHAVEAPISLAAAFAPHGGAGGGSATTPADLTRTVRWGLGFQLYPPGASLGAPRTNDPDVAAVEEEVEQAGAFRMLADTEPLAAQRRPRSGVGAATVGGASGSARAFGHTGLGGSVGFFDPVSGCAAAVVLNQLSRDRAATRAILELLRKHGPLTVGPDMGVPA